MNLVWFCSAADPSHKNVTEGAIKNKTALFYFILVGCSNNLKAVEKTAK